MLKKCLFSLFLLNLWGKKHSQFLLCAKSKLILEHLSVKVPADVYYHLAFNKNFALYHLDTYIIAPRVIFQFAPNIRKHLLSRSSYQWYIKKELHKKRLNKTVKNLSKYI